MKRLTLSPPTEAHAIAASVLGKPGRDNALHVCVHTGQKTWRYLFDCGADCLAELSISEIQKIDAIFFSHLHFDHIAGFDHFLRFNFDREDKPVRIFGPRGTATIIHHRLQGILWDRVDGSPGKFFVTEIDHDSLATFLILTAEGFKNLHHENESRFCGRVKENNDVAVDAVILDHGTPSIGYIVKQKPQQSVDTARLQAAGLAPGPWLGMVKDPTRDSSERVEIGDAAFSLGELREKLIFTREGESVGYLTDFMTSPEIQQELVKVFSSCGTLVCENNYRDADRELARKNFHMVSSEVAGVAQSIAAGRLVLFHLSDRYTVEEWSELIGEVRELFPETYYPYEWAPVFGEA